MLFKFLTYLQPTHYFSLLKYNKETSFPIFEGLPESVKEQLQPDLHFKSRLATEYDLSWQAIQKGFIGKFETLDQFEQVTIHDEYVFARKYFHKAWVFYVLLIRLLGFNNPFKEIPAYFKTRHVNRSNYLNAPISYNQWVSFKSKLVDEQPKVSVVIPTLNRYLYLEDVLKDLEQQDYTNFEVLVVDQSDPFQEDFYKNFNLDLHVDFQEEKALWLARNKAIRRARGEFMLLFDDDSRVESNWITNHLKCLDFYEADISSGVSISAVGAEVPKHYSFFRISDQLDTGNVLIKKAVFKALGLFDRQFEMQRMGDGEFGLRAHLNGFLNVSNPYAKRLHLKVDSGGLREMGSWDAFRTKKWFAPRPIPSVLYLFRSYFGDHRSKLALLRTIPMSIMPYKFKKNKMMVMIGVFISLLILPLVVVQVLRSWKLSSKKIKQGPLIKKL